MSENIEYHDYFGELEIGDIGGWSGEIYFPPINNKVQILIPGDECDICVPDKCELFFKELISFYPVISVKIQENLFGLHNEFDDMKAFDDVWKIFQLESIMLSDQKLDDSNYWLLTYGTDYGGHIIDFEMTGRNISDSLLQG